MRRIHGRRDLAGAVVLVGVVVVLAGCGPQAQDRSPSPVAVESSTDGTDPAAFLDDCEAVSTLALELDPTAEGAGSELAAARSYFPPGSVDHVERGSTFYPTDEAGIGLAEIRVGQVGRRGWFAFSVSACDS